MTLWVTSLDERHNLSNFSCGNAELDRWLRDHARSAVGQGTRTYVVAGEDGAVVGYFAIAPHVLSRDEVPRSIGRGAPREIPAVLLAKLALSEHLQGEGVGTELLEQALGTVIGAARRAGGKLVVVDAIDDAAAEFYEHHDFKRLPNRPDRLVMKLSTAARALDLPWP